MVTKITDRVITEREADYVRLCHLPGVNLRYARGQGCEDRRVRKTYHAVGDSCYRELNKWD